MNDRHLWDLAKDLHRESACRTANGLHIYLELQRVRDAKDKPGLAAVIAAAREFVAKVERGEARSVKSYAAFKAALDQLDSQ